jgi:hypothetical protein
MGWFWRRPSPPRDRQGYPQRGFVTIVSAEAQEWEFVRAKSIQRHGPLPLLQTESDRWLGQADATALLGELTALAANPDLSPDERLRVRRASTLVHYGVETGTGIQIVPPD